MGRGMVVFALVFLVLPLLAFIATVALGAGTLLAMLGLVLLVTGFVFGPAFFDLG